MYVCDPKPESSWFHLPKQNQMLHSAGGGKEDALTGSDKELKEGQHLQFGFQKMFICAPGVFSLRLTLDISFSYPFSGKACKAEATLCTLGHGNERN